MQNQPFLTGFPTTLFGSTKRSLQEAISSDRRSVESCGHLQALFGNILRPKIFNAFQIVPGKKRIRQFPLETTFWGFLSQILGANGSLAEAVACIQAWKKSQSKVEPSAATGGYCRARQAIPFELLKELHHETQRHLNNVTTTDDWWRGHVIKMVDGTSVQTADTVENQEEWPQPSGQKQGCGFPVAYIGALLNWTSGAWEEWCVYPNGYHESKIMQDLLEGINKGDVLIADRAYSSYHLMCQLFEKGAHIISRLHQRRKLDWKQGRKLSGANDRLFTFHKPQQPQHHFLTKEKWSSLPKELEIRIIRVEGKDREGRKRPMWIATTLTDHNQYPAEEIALLYQTRWDIELRIRDIKTTMEMEFLKTKSPDMIKRELMMFAIGFNLLRYLQVRAANDNQVCPTRLSFKGVMDVISAMPQTQCRTGSKGRQNLLDWVIEKVGQRVIPLRPDRQEPRAKKRRSKPYQLLTSPRSHFKEISHKGRYKK